MREIVFALLLALALPPASADAPLEARVMALSAQLRCLVCQNQTIAESDAPLAVDLRTQVREKLAQGMSEELIADYMVARYGDFVLYRPPLKPATWALWFGPALLLVAGVTLLWRRLRSAGSRDEAAPVEEATAPPGAAPLLPRREVLMVCAGVVVGAAALYGVLGTPAAIAPAPMELSLSEAEAMIEQLSRHLRTDPGNAQGWLLLARAQTATRHYAEAAQAYRQLIILMPEDPQLRTAYADVLAQSRAKEPSGK